MPGEVPVGARVRGVAGCGGAGEELIAAEVLAGELCSTDTDTRIGIGRIRIRGYGNFLKNPIHGYVLLF